MSLSLYITFYTVVNIIVLLELKRTILGESYNYYDVPTYYKTP